MARASQGQGLPTPLKQSEFAYYLAGYDQEIAQYIIQGISSGFDIGYKGLIANLTAKNGSTISEYFEQTKNLLQKEILLERIAGPFDIPPFAHTHISPILARPKPNSSEIRLILNLSAPYDYKSINANIPEEKKSVQYQPLTLVLNKILELGPGCFIAKSDIKSAFRLLPVAPSDYHLLGFMFNHNYYFDRCMSMGLGSACQIFETLATAINWIFVNKFGFYNCFHYLDDYCLIEDSREKASLSLLTFQAMCKKLGVPLSPDKTVGPSQQVTYLGIHLDTLKMQASIPEEKITQYIQDIKSILHSRTCSQGDLKSVIGKLNWVSSIILPGRSFLRRLHDAVRGPHSPNKLIHLSTEIKKDLITWLGFLMQFNGKSMISYFPVQDSAYLNFYSDASHKGAGATFNNQWIQFEYPPHWSNRSIAYLELYPIVVITHMFSSTLRNSRIIFHTDNWSIMHVLNKASSKCPLIMTLIRPLMSLALKNNFLITSKHVSGSLNLIPDRISRFQITSQDLKEAGMDLKPTPIPQKWLPVIWERTETSF